MSTTPAQKMARERADWHRADIKAALEKAGWSLRQLSLAHGYEGSTLNEVHRRPWPKAERIIADALGVQHPMEIWPSRYNTDGSPSRGPNGRMPRRPANYTPKPSTMKGAGNTQTKGRA